jgi:hypothetical protein
MQEFHKLAAALLQPSATKTIHSSFKNNRNGVGSSFSGEKFLIFDVSIPN